MEAKKFIKDFSDKDQVRSVFLVHEKLLLKDKNSKSYMSLNLGDVSGQINGRLWDKVEDVAHTFDSGDFVWIKGHIQTYQNRIQLVIHDLRKADEGEYDLADFVSSAEQSSEEMFSRLISLVNSISDPNLKSLMLSCLTDEEVKPKLMVAPGAKTIHHAYLGGLLEHILSICEIMVFLAGHYKFLNRDYLLFGAIFHDIGKIWELDISAGIKYTDRGRLIGHMALACEFLDKKADQQDNFPVELRDICKHIILSHHGKLEYGSPKRPKFLEAMLVAMIDDLDSKVNTMKRLMDGELGSGQSWTQYNAAFERYLYLDVLREMNGKSEQ